MPAKFVSLSMHRNKVEGRRKRDLARTVSAQTASLIREKDVKAYAFVGLASDGSVYALWDTGAALPLRAFAPMVAEVIATDVHNCMSDGMKDDWRPPLTSRESTR